MRYRLRKKSSERAKWQILWVEKQLRGPAVAYSASNRVGDFALGL